jgi:hypothetical protein
MDTRLCACGAQLLSREECLASDDEILRHVGETYLDDDTYFCAEEDDVVPVRLDVCQRGGTRTPNSDGAGSGRRTPVRVLALNAPESLHARTRA